MRHYHHRRMVVGDRLCKESIVRRPSIFLSTSLNPRNRSTPLGHNEQLFSKQRQRRLTWRRPRKTSIHKRLVSTNWYLFFTLSNVHVLDRVFSIVQNWILVKQFPHGMVFLLCNNNCGNDYTTVSVLVMTSLVNHSSKSRFKRITELII